MSEQAVIVTFQYGQTDLDALFELEDRLRDAIEEAGCGEYDGHKIASDGSDGILYMYGPDADKLLEAVEPILRTAPFMTGASIEKRSSPPDGEADSSDENDGSEVIEQAVELRKRGMMAEAAAMLAPLTSVDDLDIRVQALLELAVTHSVLQEHRLVLASMDQLERCLNDHFGYNVLEMPEDGSEDDGLHQVRLLRHTNSADAYSGLGRMDEAIEHARAAATVVRCRREPGDEDRLAHREYVVATMLRSVGRLEEALVGLDAALKESPGHIPSLIAKATYLELAGRKGEGEALFATIHPGDEAGRAYFTLNASWYYALRGEKAQMLKLLEDATYYWGGQFVVAYALEEKDFASYRDDAEFAACIERCRLRERGARG